MTTTLRNTLMTMSALAVLGWAGAALAEDVDKTPAPAAPGEKQIRVVVSGDDEDGPLKIETFGTGKRGYLGVALLDLTPELRKHFGVGEDAGVLVSRVEPDSPAAKAGLAVGDIIVGIGSAKAGRSLDIQRAVRDKKDKDVVSIDVVRDGRAKTLSATLTERDRELVDVSEMLQMRHGGPLVAMPDPEAMKMLGERLRELDRPEFREKIERYRTHERDLEQRMKELEKRLEELQKKLAEKTSLRVPPSPPHRQARSI